MSSQGLLVGFSQAPKSAEEIAAFTEWYDDEHAPARLTVPGITTARRYHDLENRDDYLATYDLDSIDVLETQPYRTLREELSEREQRVIATLPLLERAIYSSLPTPASARADENICGDFLLCVWWTPEPGTEEDFHAWYDEEHIPLLMTVPGWLRIRRYKLETGGGPKFLAVHDLSDPDATTSKEHDVIDTPWRDKVTKVRVDYERHIYELLRRFD